MTTASDRPDSGPVKLGGFSKESTKVIRQLEEYGWTFTVSRQGHAIGHAPDGVTRTSISKNLSRANRSQQAAEATVKRWERALAERKAVDEIDKAEVTMNAEQDHPYDPVLTPMLLAATQKHVNKSGTAFGEAIIADLPSAPEPRATAISRAPWLARQGTSRSKGTTSLYESGAVVEVTWSDGTLTYECSIEECDYASPNPRSVSSHFRGHVRRGDHEPVGQLARPSVAKDVPVTEYREGYTGKTYEPSERLLAALEAFLADAGTTDIRALAYAALVWARERPDLGDIEEREREPLDDGQILAKIRLLVGGRDVELEEAHRHTLTSMEVMRLEHEEAVAAMEERLRLAEERATSLQENLDAWLSLAPRPE